MLMNRRTLVAGMAASSFSLAAHAQPSRDWSALAVEDTAAPLLPDDLATYSNQPSLNEQISGYQPFGTSPPTSQESMLAKKVLDGVPTSTTPITVALYFLSVGAGQAGAELRPYITAWPVRWNPVIVEFFSATRTQPSGDTTAWCAAFMNFCLIKAATGKTLPANAATPTLSAAARSFREWGKSVADLGVAPRPGDIVVFRRKDSPAHGHVGFFLAEKADSVLVLGGNQFEGTPTRHTVNRKWMAKDGLLLALVSYRTDPQLHA